MEPEGGLYRVIKHSLPSLLSTNGVLILSLASFVVAAYIPNRMFGLLTAFVFVVALVADLLLTPALLPHETETELGEGSRGPGFDPILISRIELVEVSRELWYSARRPP